MKDKSVQLLKMLRKDATIQGLKIVKIVAESPPMFSFEGSPQVLDAEIFEIPNSFLPLTLSSKYFALPMAGANSQRWGLIQKIT